MSHDSQRLLEQSTGIRFLPNPVTDELIDEVRSFYRTRNVPHATVQIAPSLLPANWRDICATMNLEEEGATYKLACRTEAAVAAACAVELHSDLSVTAVDALSADEWSQVMPNAMGMSSRRSIGTHCRSGTSSPRGPGVSGSWSKQLPPPESANTSYQNLLRFGFDLGYVLQNETLGVATRSPSRSLIGLAEGGREIALRRSMQAA